MTEQERHQFQLAGQIQGLEYLTALLVSMFFAGRSKDDADFTHSSQQAIEFRDQLHATVAKMRADDRGIHPLAADAFFAAAEGTIDRCLSNPAARLDQVAKILLQMRPVPSAAKN